MDTQPAKLRIWNTVCAIHTLPWKERTYFLRASWVTLAIFIALSIVEEILIQANILHEGVSSLAFSILFIPYSICCIRFAIDNKRDIWPEGWKQPQFMTEDKRMVAGFFGYQLLQQLVSGVAIAGGGTAVFSADAIHWKGLGAALVLAGAFFFVGMAFTLAAKATGRPTSIKTSFQLLKGNYLRYLLIMTLVALSLCVQFAILTLPLILIPMPNIVSTGFVTLAGCLMGLHLVTIVSLSIAIPYQKLVVQRPPSAHPQETI